MDHNQPSSSHSNSLLLRQRVLGALHSNRYMDSLRHPIFNLTFTDYCNNRTKKKIYEKIKTNKEKCKNNTLDLLRFEKAYETATSSEIYVLPTKVPTMMKRPITSKRQRKVQTEPNEETRKEISIAQPHPKK